MHATETIVAINIAPDINPTSVKGGRLELVSALLESGAESVITKAADYDFENGTVNALRVAEIIDVNPNTDPDRKDFLVPSFALEPVTLSLRAIGAIRNTAAQLGHHPGELNPPAVRNLTRDRAQVNTLLSELGRGRPHDDFNAYGAADWIEDKLDRLPGDKVVLRPRKGIRAGKKPIKPKTLDRAEVMRRYAAGELVGQAENDEWVIEAVPLFAPEVLSGEPLARSIGAGDLLRVIGFGEDDKRLQLSVLARTADGTGKPAWHEVGASAGQRKVLTAAHKIIFELGARTGEHEMHVAVDFTATGPRGGLTVAEIVGAEPNLAVGDNTLRRELAGNAAKQLIRVARAGGTK